MQTSLKQALLAVQALPKERPPQTPLVQRPLQHCPSLLQLYDRALQAQALPTQFAEQQSSFPTQQLPSIAQQRPATQATPPQHCEAVVQVPASGRQPPPEG